MSGREKSGMRKYPLGMCLASSMLLVAGCATAPRAPLTAGGERIEIMVFSDRGNPDEMDERQYQRRIEVGQWMEGDLIDLLTRSGYQAALIGSKEEFKARDGRYLLTVKIVKYNPGSSAARIIVGFGAGAASLDNHYELYGTAPHDVG
jgi:hypothetical protein